MAPIALTKELRDDVEWAFSAMEDYWGARCAPGGAPDPESEACQHNELTVPDGATMPYIDAGGALVLSSWEEPNTDLAYRLGTQLVMMLDDNLDISSQKRAARKRALERLAEKIEA